MTKFFSWSCAAALCLPTLLYPQGPGASITGEIRDPSGAIIASAMVTARNTGTNVTRTTVSDSAGVFVLAPLAPASYEITVEMAGFKRDVRSGIILQVGLSSLGTVPLSPFVCGDFSYLLTMAKPIQLVDPLTKQPIAGNIVPKTLISSTGTQIAPYFPAANPTAPGAHCPHPTTISARLAGKP